MTLREKYIKQVMPKMKKKFGYKNDLAVPKIEKVVINVGLNVDQTSKDPKFQEIVEKTLRQISGQEPAKKLAKKSISGFKIREGQLVGLTVILRGQRMYDFIEKLFNIVLPRLRDFKGLKLSSFDGSGNYNLTIKDQTYFPEIDLNKINQIRTLQITLVTSTSSQDRAKMLLSALGLPFEK